MRHRLEPADLPAAFRAADGAAIAGQRMYRRLLAIELVAVVSGSVVGAATGKILASPAVAASIAAATFLAAIVARLVRERRQDDRQWFDGRAVAESAKTQAWRYMMRVPPFDDQQVADRRFAEGLVAVLRSRSRVVEPDMQFPGPDSQISQRMRAMRRLSVPARRDLYVNGRLLEQAEWYRSAAVRHRSSAQRWSWFSLASETLAILVAILTVVAPPIGELGLLGVLGAGAAACTAWTQVGRHDEASRSYGLAYQELLMICSLATDTTDEDDLHRLVLDGESAISREHTMWVAKRSELLTAEEIKRLPISSTARSAERQG